MNNVTNVMPAVNADFPVVCEIHGIHYHCPRCNTCYVCTHTAFQHNGPWYWRCADGAVRLAYPEQIH